MKELIWHSSLCWSISLLMYYVLLRKMTFFSINRWYLIGTLLFGLALTPVTDQLQKWLSNDTRYFVAGLLPEIQINSAVDVALQSTFPWVWSLYGIGVLFFLIRFFWGLYRIGQLYSHGLKEDYQSYVLVSSEKVSSPFSFFHLIFLNPKQHNRETLHPIIDHEKMHIRLGHSFDLVLIELLSCVLWFQPLLRLYKKAIKETHEFIADEKVSHEWSLDLYVKTLLFPTQPLHELNFVNPFYQSQIKNRILMLHTHRSRRKHLLFYLLSPIVLGSLALVLSSFSSHSALEVSKKLGMELDTVPPPPPPAPKARLAPPPPPPPPSPASPKDAPAMPDQIDALVPPPPPPPPPPPVKRTGPGLASDQVDEMPRFPGCENAGSSEERYACSNQKLMVYVIKEMKYPEMARKKNTQGRCIARFTVNTDGYIENIVIDEEPGDGTGEEVVRILSKMNQLPERWIPGKKDGKPVAAIMTLPVNFWLDKK